MRIDFSQIDVVSSNVDKIAYEPSNEKNISHSMGYQLDISSTVKDNAVFGSYGKNGQGMTLNEYLQEKGIADNGLSMSDAKSTMLRRNYMAVMSNSLSTKDFAEAIKDGYHLGKMDVSEAVNVVDQIKIKLIEAGVTIKGFTDTVDSDKIEALVGKGSYSAAISSKLSDNDLPITNENITDIENSLDMVKTIEEHAVDGKLPDSSIRTIISGNLNPTIENVFMTLFQSGQYNPSNNPSSFNQFKDQIKGIIERSDIEYNEESILNANWLYDNDLPINENNLKALSDLKDINLPVDKNKLLDNMSDAISLGFSSKEASLITNRRILLEVRLSMTTEANRRLLQSDFSIDTKEMEEDLAQIKVFENSIKDNEQLSDSSKLFDYTNNTISQLREMPAAVVAKFNNAAAFTVIDVYEAGSTLKAEYQKANESYEALRTEIRSDLGDNIKTAFRNVSSLLKENNIDASESNQRAARILGYNQMEINKENIATVKSVDRQITRLIDHLNPGNTLRLIKEGINPLTKSVSELNDILDSFNDNEAKNEKYSEYLVKLEHNKQITPEERESYIGIYRLLRQVEENDGAAIGTLINSGAELSIKNLLSAVRSRKAAKIDVSINDTFGVLDELPIDSSKIDVQISQAFDQPDFYKKETSDLLSNLNPEKLREMWNDGRLTQDTTLDQLYDQMETADNEASKIIEEEYFEHSAEEFRKNMHSEQEVEKLLQNYDIPLSADNIYAASQILEFRGQTFKNLRELSDKLKEKENINHIFTSLQEFEDKETMQKAYDDLANLTSSMIEKEVADSAMSADEFRRMRLLSKQIVITNKLSREENYEVPVETEKGITSVNLKIVHTNTTPEVMASMSIPDIGDLIAHMLVNDNKVSGYLMAETDNGISFLKSIKDTLDSTLDTEFIITKKANIEINKKISEKNTSEEEYKISTVKLYSMAKAFIQAVNNK